jgi:hypothetical protein
MKSREEIDELYHKYWDDFSNKYDDNLHYYSFVEGYTQCQEDMGDKKYTELQLRSAMEGAMVFSKLKQITEYIISLNKQD